MSERARGLIGQAQRWLPRRELIVVADGGYAVLDLLAWCQRLTKPVTVISRLRMDGALFTRPPHHADRDSEGRRQVKGKRLADTESQYLASRQHQVEPRAGEAGTAAFGGGWRSADATAVWWRAGKPPVPIRWVLGP